jgi:hypothetical protein
MAKKLYTEDFVQRANVVHDYKYCYSKSVYTGIDNKLIIICPIHGDFEQIAYVHLTGCGCPDCGGRKKSSLQKFVVVGNLKHNNVYSYDGAVYVNSKTKIKIVCADHGPFYMTPSNHLQGQGCPECAGGGILTEDRFLRNAKVKHSGKYSYSKFTFISSRVPSTITCPMHGDYKQTPCSHLAGAGCPDCGGSKPITPQYIDEKLRSLNTGIVCIKYPKTAKDKALFKCSKNHEWESRVDHVTGGRSSCPTCAKYGFDKSLPATLYLYAIGTDYLGFGITNDFDTRHKKHTKTFGKHSTPYALLNTWVTTGNRAAEIELGLKRTFEIVSSGMAGFVKECTHIHNLKDVVAYITENTTSYS